MQQAHSWRSRGKDACGRSSSCQFGSRQPRPTCSGRCRQRDQRECDELGLHRVWLVWLLRGRGKGKEKSGRERFLAQPALRLLNSCVPPRPPYCLKYEDPDHDPEHICLTAHICRQLASSSSGAAKPSCQWTTAGGCSSPFSRRAREVAPELLCALFHTGVFSPGDVCGTLHPASPTIAPQSERP